ncbi:substrate-binding domain-containing protein [Pseudomonas sp. 22-AL-CL-001]|uniref:phosphate ABC transporter substrate-binding/OmpA family protein n=1 Tax=Pseudomonas alabamensis TaxID=3064349 RepID=UPI00271397FF|nr:substrate-binding domain-containing protein [Pseudomonas sp. 22-AL-CL-001]MDO7911534.1 substrate-binding domain-containing protein [Pseudomonas sp. 22-AL-CL-001]
MRHVCLLLSLWLSPAWAAEPLLRIAGSNTLGAAALPTLVHGWLAGQGASDIRTQASPVLNEVSITALGTDGQPLRVEIAAHGTQTGFDALAAGRADLAAASRPLDAVSAWRLRALGDLHAAEAEQVIGLDGVAVVVHPANPLKTLTLDQLTAVFAGRLRNWEQLGVPGGEIHVLARDGRSGTFDTFRALLLDDASAVLTARAERFESNAALVARVASDPQAIGFSSLTALHHAKVLAIAAGDAPALLPTPATVASEDYPLTRRLYVYRPTALQNPSAKALVAFMHSPAGQAIVARQGFVSQQVLALPTRRLGNVPVRYQALQNDALRLNVSLRFQPASATLDNKALHDVQRIATYVRGRGLAATQVTLVGFGDPKQTPGRAALLSRLRTMAVRRELARAGVDVREVLGLGDQLPVADNGRASGRQRNRRVEVWVR